MSFSKKSSGKWQNSCVCDVSLRSYRVLFTCMWSNIILQCLQLHFTTLLQFTGLFSHSIETICRVTLDSKQTNKIIIIIWRNSVITCGGHVTQTRLKYIRERKGEKQTDRDRQKQTDRQVEKEIYWELFSAVLQPRSFLWVLFHLWVELVYNYLWSMFSMHLIFQFRAKLLLTSDYNTDTNMQAKLMIFVSVVRLVSAR